MQAGGIFVHACRRTWSTGAPPGVPPRTPPPPPTPPPAVAHLGTHAHQRNALTHEGSGACSSRPLSAGCTRAWRPCLRGDGGDIVPRRTAGVSCVSHRISSHPDAGRNPGGGASRWRGTPWAAWYLGGAATTSGFLKVCACARAPACVCVCMCACVPPVRVSVAELSVAGPRPMGNLTACVARADLVDYNDNEEEELKKKGYFAQYERLKSLR